ncbi:MAG: hypothetical protein H8F28_11625 [Fibrella sp.]|nr:hypothetical protein [Armatimonadota bacterium]
MKKLLLPVNIAIALLCCLAATSCSSTTQGNKMTEKEKADFKGGPMPPEARAEMAKRMQAANAPMPAQEKATK